MKIICHFMDLSKNIHEGYNEFEFIEYPGSKVSFTVAARK